jgi:ElaB/YqjD/DUF883 family membrane-anchored ribosome-binding protein
MPKKKKLTPDEKIKEALSEIRASLEDSLSETKESVSKTSKVIEKTINEHPWKAVGLASVLGLVAGILISKDKK